MKCLDVLAYVHSLSITPTVTNLRTSARAWHRFCGNLIVINYRRPCVHGWIPPSFLPPIQYVNIFDLWIWFETINHIMLMKDEKAYKKDELIFRQFFITALLLKSNLTLITKINKYKSLLWWVSLSIKEGMYHRGTLDNFCRFIPRKDLFVFFLFWSENWGKIITRSKADILEKDTYIKTTLKGETSN